MVEKDFQLSLAKGLHAQGAFAEKWPDLARAVTKPFDLCVAYQGHFIPIECKLRKLKRKKPLHPSDTVIFKTDLHGQQLPTLMTIWVKGQGTPYVAVCLAREENLRIVEKRAWMIPVQYLEECAERYSVADLEVEARQGLLWELGWWPSIGWIAPWLPQPS